MTTKFRKIFVFIAFGLVLGGELRAAVINYASQTINFSNFTTVTRTFNFNLVDTAFGGTSSFSLNDIVSISITANLLKSAGSWEITEIEESPQTVTATQSTKAWFTSLKSIGINGSSASPALDSPFNQVISIDPLATVTGDFGTASASVGGSLDSSVFSQFLGSGTFGIVLSGAQSFVVTGGAVNQQSSPPRLSGDVTVTYGVVPEPSSASLLIFGLGGLIALRRARRNSV